MPRGQLGRFAKVLRSSSPEPHDASLLGWLAPSVRPTPGVPFASTAPSEREDLSPPRRSVGTGPMCVRHAAFARHVVNASYGSFVSPSTRQRPSKCRPGRVRAAATNDNNMPIADRLSGCDGVHRASRRAGTDGRRCGLGALSGLAIRSRLADTADDCAAGTEPTGGSVCPVVDEALGAIAEVRWPTYVTRVRTPPGPHAGQVVCNQIARTAGGP